MRTAKQTGAHQKEVSLHVGQLSLHAREHRYLQPTMLRRWTYFLSLRTATGRVQVNKSISVSKILKTSGVRNLPLPTCSLRLQLTPLRLLSVHSGQQQQAKSEQSESIGNLDAGNRQIDPHTGKRKKISNWNYRAELYALAQRLGHNVTDVPSLKVALTHKSLPSLNSKESSNGQHNGRLTVFGNAILVHYVQEYLYFTYPNLEGHMLFDLTEFLTNHGILADAANYLGITNLIRCNYKLKDDSMIGRAFCAVVGALYVDNGPKDARKVVHDFLLPQLAGKDFHELIKFQHPKFMLRVILQRQGRPAPISRLLKETGRLTHFPSFVVGVYSGEKLLAEGCGTSLKRAEKEAITAALIKHFQVDMSSISLPSDHEEYMEESEIDLSLEQSLEKS